MAESNALGEEARARDYRLYEQQLFGLLRRIGLVFLERADPYKLEKEKFRSDLLLDDDLDVFGAALAFFPNVDHHTVDTLVKILNGQGVFQENNDLLAVFRHFHHHKYK
jgi:hypothetical protein